MWVCSGQEACFATQPQWCDTNCEVWLMPAELSPARGSLEFGRTSPAQRIYPVFLWEDWPSCSPESLREPHADQEPPLSIAFRCGESPFLQGLVWFVCQTQGSVMHSMWSATLWRCPGFLLRYKRWLLNSIKWFWDVAAFISCCRQKFMQFTWKTCFQNLI